MFLDYYHLREQPFGVTPDPRYLYFSPGHREALASLFCGIETGRGFLALIAEPGMGKTTLLYQLLERLKSTIRSVFLFQTQCDSRELLRYLLDGLGLDGGDGDLVRMHRQLNAFLLGEAQAGRRVVLFIDEAQNLSDTVLETVRLLTDFEAPDRKLLQIVLAGQPELGHRLLRPGLGQLRQRIAVRTHLHPLPAVEIDRYIQHRLQVAGYDGPELFTAAAVALIASASAGIPRNVNNICYSALSIGCATGRKEVTPAIVREALADLSLDSSVARPEPDSASAMAPVATAAPLAAQTSHFVAEPVAHASLLQRIRHSFRALKEWLCQPAGQRSVASNPRLRRSAVVVLACGGLIALFGGGKGDAGRAASAAGPASQAVAAEFSAKPPAVSADAANAPHETSASVDTAGDLLDSATYVVRPRDTLSQLCVRSIGRYDAAVLTEIRNLNPTLVDPDHIRVGQQVRLPRDAKEKTAAPRAGSH